MFVESGRIPDFISGRNVFWLARLREAAYCHASYSGIHKGSCMHQDTPKTTKINFAESECESLSLLRKNNAPLCLSFSFFQMIQTAIKKFLTLGSI